LARRRRRRKATVSEQRLDAFLVALLTLFIAPFVLMGFGALTGFDWEVHPAAWLAPSIVYWIYAVLRASLPWRSRLFLAAVSVAVPTGVWLAI
jgi:hypothetical protein